MKAMYESLMSSMDKKEEMEVPQELSAQTEEVEVDLAAEEVAPITHTPEAEVSKAPLSLYAQKGPKTTVDSVFNKLFKNKLKKWLLLLQLLLLMLVSLQANTLLQLFCRFYHREWWNRLLNQM
jgi:hypothetical protein